MALKILNREVRVDGNGLRRTTYIVEGRRSRPRSIYAVCVRVNDPDELTLSKLYRVKLSGEFATVVDDEGEVAVYPADYFAPVSVSKETRSRIESALSV